ncbi:hypothetical protein GCM10011428_57500 [Streptomyces violaceus]|uniref:hypothetical protein n=1 Tax=Streptomyces violaceus TaxID=1936 RepID=UPI0031F0A5FD
MPATVVAEAGYLAGVLDAARAGLGAALLAVPGGQHPDGLVPYRGLPGVPPVRLSALARRGSDPSLTGGRGSRPCGPCSRPARRTGRRSAPPGRQGREFRWRALANLHG